MSVNVPRMPLGRLWPDINCVIERMCKVTRWQDINCVIEGSFKGGCEVPGFAETYEQMKVGCELRGVETSGTKASRPIRAGRASQARTS